MGLGAEQKHTLSLDQYSRGIYSVTVVYGHTYSSKIRWKRTVKKVSEDIVKSLVLFSTLKLIDQPTPLRISELLL